MDYIYIWPILFLFLKIIIIFYPTRFTITGKWIYVSQKLLCKSIYHTLII